MIARKTPLSIATAFIALVFQDHMPAYAGDDAYPVVITRPSDLDDIGVSISNYGAGSNVDHPNNCYYYGDSGYDLSFSKAFLAHHKKRGFSRRSLCMAVLSGVRFDPESGNRLPTIISVDLDGLEAPEASTITGELPLDVPDCFKGALPFSDCTMRYDLMTGQRLSPEAQNQWREIGLLIKNSLSSREVRNTFAYIEESNQAGETIFVGGGQMPLANLNFNGLGIDAQYGIAFYDYSSSFPSGFGYSIYGYRSRAKQEELNYALDHNRRSTQRVLSMKKQLMHE